MWRCEEGLAYWLRNSPPEFYPGFLHRVLLGIARWIGFSEPSSLVNNYPLELLQVEIPACPLDLYESVKILDGLSAIASAPEQGHEHGEALVVQSICLSEEAKPISVDFRFGNHARVHSESPLVMSRVQSERIEFPLKPIQKLTMVSANTAEIQTGRYWLYSRPLPVHTDTLRLLKAPHLRWSCDLSRVGLRELERFIREASRLRGIQPENGEVLAVFARVPIEIVADYRYIEEKQLLIYTITLDKPFFTTRIHDLAAIRVKGTGKTYLVADQSRFQTAFLN